MKTVENTDGPSVLDRGQPAAATALARREFLQRTGAGIGGVALASLLDGGLFGRAATAADANATAASTAAARQPRPHFPPRAKSVIYLHMVGAPSQLDLFDHKPALVERDGQRCPDAFFKGKRLAFIREHPVLLGTRFGFGRHGQSGQEFSELLPHLAGVADELTVIKTLHTEQFNHAPAQLFLGTGAPIFGRPSLGAWTSYGLGSENADLPAYVVLITGQVAGAGNSLWGSGFLPTVHQGVEFRSRGDPVLFLSDPPGIGREDRREIIDGVRELNEIQLADVGDPEIATRISQYEMAYRMQTSVPELMDLSAEPQHVLDLYGARPGEASFANNCLLARRLVERGVRFVQLFDQGWDHHSGIFNGLPKKAQQVDRPAAALVADLRQRGLLDETLVVWGAEFGRTPMLQGKSNGGADKNIGRDHHKEAYTVWMAGGGLRPGLTYGRTDELGYGAAENPMHVHDLNATILHLLGLDHESLTYRYQGRDFRLTDVAGVVPDALLG